MNQITLANFRCFRAKQAARLAPLTLLVGENSTGKTSFMALIRALWDAAYLNAIPDFKESPYDLGSFDEVLHQRSRRTDGVGHIEAGILVRRELDFGGDEGPYRVDVRFVRQGTAPLPGRWRLARGDVWIEERVDGDSARSIHCATADGEWRQDLPARDVLAAGPRSRMPGAAILRTVFGPFFEWDSNPDPSDFDLLPSTGPSAVPGEARSQIFKLIVGFVGYGLPGTPQRPFASAPVRSKPRRTYDPARPVRDPEGENIPMYLSTAFFENRKSWEGLKDALESFGRQAGLFDEISVRPLGRRGTEPFQMHVRKHGPRAKGPMRNLIDVGYGVSQVLPILTELFRDNQTSMFLLQQPEVHLHPSAQAALGSLFCEIASPRRQLVVETHSDHLLDRVRMDVRDGRTKLTPDDVSILFFERGDLDAQIHSLRLDAEGNVLGAPPSYRGFFLEESRRSLRL